MPLVTTKDMFKKAYEGHYAVGAFNVNNMEIVQGIVDAAKEEESPLILQVSAGARKYAKHAYLLHLVQAALEDTDRIDKTCCRLCPQQRGCRGSRIGKTSRCGGRR